MMKDLLNRDLSISASNRPYFETQNRTIRIIWYVSTVQ